MNRIYPQNIDTDSLGSTKSHLTDKKGATHDQPDCCRKCFSWTLCTRRCICVSAISLIIVGIIIAIIALTVTVGIPPLTPVNRLCVTTSKQTGFLCDNRETCISASEVCDTRQNCANGEDEQEALCSKSLMLCPSSCPLHITIFFSRIS
ncbi:low-density lipoprotein receptor class A domain-containing protein 1 isoform X2 [Ahaetulla prasina]|uniref:low-density lipoprotein receptor class A domain-containing protein 1 isoform X2 n=1 Tax=Ahaetulla prasina TaxID=499056 RepID=UPI0026476331|nr:low-density lipoprotein receptor class A domain-containing protein 1 isoform X2 [Ahaetulla prasina]